MLIADTSVLVNFLCIDQAALLSRLGEPIQITTHVIAEITDDYLEQKLRLEAAIRAGVLEVIEVTDPAELALFAALSSSHPSRRRRLGLGESAAIAVAATRGHSLVIEDGPAIKQAKALYPTLVIVRTQDLILRLIRSGHLTVEVADQLKAVWAAHHRFALPFASFADLLVGDV